MTPFLFGSSDRRLFGILSPREANHPPELGVVLCNAFGREAIRAHRVFRVLADRLSRMGCDVLRFDYFGTGDSAGADSEVDLDGFKRDLLTAHLELERRTGVPSVAWIGMRLGATVAQSAMTANPAELVRVVLWDPLADGRDYLDLLRRRQLEWETAGENPIGDVPPVFRSNPSIYIDEAIGFPIPRRFCDQLRAWRIAKTPLYSAPVALVIDPGTTEGRAIADEFRGKAIDLSEIAHGTDWTSEGDATGLVPPAVLNLLVQKIMGAT